MGTIPILLACPNPVQSQTSLFGNWIKTKQHIYCFAPQYVQSMLMEQIIESIPVEIDYLEVQKVQSMSHGFGGDIFMHQNVGVNCFLESEKGC